MVIIKTIKKISSPILYLCISYLQIPKEYSDILRFRGNNENV